MTAPRRRRSDWLVDRLWRALIWIARRLPYRVRVPAMGGLFRVLIGPLSGRRRQALDNLSLVFPQMPAREKRRIVRGVLDNIGRTIMETYSVDDMMARAKSWEVGGPGWPDVQAALAAGRPILFVSAHFGNYQAGRAALNQRGFDIGALYRPLNNDYLNDHYVATIADVGGGAFSRDRRGLAAFMRHLKSGAQAAILTDQYVYGGPIFDFLGHPAPTSLAAAEMALKFDALMLPAYNRRSASGLDFEIEIEPPIPHSDPITMTRALTESLAARIRETPEQWFWVHNRWKPERADQAALDAEARAQDAPGGGSVGER